MGADEGEGDNEVDDTKGGEEGGAIWRSKMAATTKTMKTKRT